MKRRNGNALPIGLVALLLTTTVVYAGITGQSADYAAQEALSTSVVTDKDDVSEEAAGSQDAAVSDLTCDEILTAGIAAQFSDVSASASKAVAASEISASSVEEKLEEATEQAKQEQKEKETQWEGRAIASNVEEYVYVRDAASTDGDVIGKLPRGGAGDVLEKGDEWTLLSSGEVEGYVSNDYLAFDAEALAVAEEVCSCVATVEIDEASIRSAADENAEVLSTASTGDVLDVVETGDEWIKVETAEGVGYLSGSIAHVELAVAEAEPVETEETETTEDAALEAQTEETSDTAAEEAPAADEDTSASDTAEEAEDTSSAEASSAAVDSASTAATTHSATFKVTAYCACSKCCGSYANGITATGTTATAGRTIAVDKSVIPLGTTVYINGVAYVAEDTGVYGNWIDLYMNSHDAALQWGVQYCTVSW